MYIITRADLSAGMQLAQCAHAAIEYAQGYDDVDDTVIVLVVPDELALAKLSLKVCAIENMNCCWFEEPDLGGSITAIALPAEAKPLLKKLPLAGRR